MNIYISMALLYLLFINTFENAYIFSLCFMVLMLLSDFIISILKKYINPKFNLILSLFVTTILVTLLEIVLKKFIPGFYNDMYYYIPLMILTIYDFDDNRSVKDSFKFTFKKCLRYIGLLLTVVLIKEVLSYGTITLMKNISDITGYREILKIPANSIIPITSFEKFGPFLITGIILGITNFIRRGKHA